MMLYIVTASYGAVVAIVVRRAPHFVIGVWIQGCYASIGILRLASITVAQAIRHRQLLIDS